MKTIEYTISEADAVRHLIVCDTQFAWAGVTNLTMPQMMDLQVRGWVVEGDDNGEFQLTEAGEEVVARALQHGVPKILADAQPGGRVKLGDALPPLPKAGYVTGGDFGHEAHNAFTPEQMREYARAALSAQPSPGGQGDAWDIAELVRTDLDRQSCPDAYMRIAMESVVKHLTARQPVGEPVCSGGFVISNGSGEKYMAWGQVGPEWTADRSAALWLVRRADAEALAAENEDAWCILPVERCALPPNGWACTLAAGHEGTCPTIAAPPAQAVDLGQFRPPVEFFIAYTFPGTPSRAEGERLLALIDGKAVGK